MKKLSIKIFLLCLAMLAFTTQANTLFKEQDKQKHIITETVINSFKTPAPSKKLRNFEKV